MPNEMTPLEAAETLEDIAAVSDLKAVDGARSGLVNLSKNDASSLRVIASMLRQIAAGELRPVIHAHWKGQSSNVGYRCVVHFACSNCGYEIADDETVNKLCPNCGALMDGKEDSHAD
ncbi:MAG TPA: hypothetical protein VHP31_12170 [Caproicibacter sp.]|nr:hypothetical protein [Caproicibacter sp.]